MPKWAAAQVAGACQTRRNGSSGLQQTAPAVIWLTTRDNKMGVGHCLGSDTTDCNSRQWDQRGLEVWRLRAQMQECCVWWSWPLPVWPMRLGFLSCSFSVVHSRLYSSGSMVAKGCTTCWPQKGLLSAAVLRDRRKQAQLAAAHATGPRRIQLLLRLRCST